MEIVTSVQIYVTWGCFSLYILLSKLVFNLLSLIKERVLPEKAGDVIKAKEQMAKHAQNASTAQEKQMADALTQLFERSNCYDNLDISSTID